MIEKSTKKFYSIDYNSASKSLIIKFLLLNAKINPVEVSLDVPTKICLNEIIYRICYEFENGYKDKLEKENELNKKSLIYLKHLLMNSLEFEADLNAFLKNLNQLFYDNLSSDLIESLKTSATLENGLPIDVKSVKSYWSKLDSKSYRNTNEAFKSNIINDCYAACENVPSNLEEEKCSTMDSYLAEMYHHLIHSEYMPKVLKLEHLFMIEYNDLINERDKFLRFMQETHQANLNEKLKPEHGYSDSYISKLAMANLEQYELEKKKWQTRIDSLKNSQQRKFSKYITKLYKVKETESSNSNKTVKVSSSEQLIDENDVKMIFDDQLTIDSVFASNSITAANKTLATKPSQNSFGANKIDLTYNKIEESYTIQLGAQLKTTHNLRLIRCDILDYCKDRFKSVNINSNNRTEFLMNQIEPHSIQTAMSLYSNKLCAVVLLGDCLIDSSKLANTSINGAIAKDQATKLNESNDSNNNSIDSNYLSNRFNDICDRNGCDFHFLSNEQQTLSACKLIKLVKNLDSNESSNINLDSSTNSDSEIFRLKVGDFYTTKHSNLSQVHIIFHLATFESDKVISSNNTSFNNEADNLDFNTRSSKSQSLKQSDLSSRHPVILGLRNILKTCISNNIQTLTFPLLLTHEMNEEMTVNWVMKRAELVFKCIKGFMIEFVQWGAQESRTLQFVVPQGLMDETFIALSNLITSIFRESRTVNLN